MRFRYETRTALLMSAHPIASSLDSLTMEIAENAKSSIYIQASVLYVLETFLNSLKYIIIRYIVILNYYAYSSK